ncbi:hypothetical protein [Streptomyces sp. NPDC050704]|uniref:hypothetical protein n=1 Tax=Streptomyces sp. NPDC050704 TaxID=3157219 RepID=UPI0034236ECC
MGVEQRLERAVVGVVVRVFEPVADVVPLSAPDLAEFGTVCDVRRAGRELELAFGDSGPDADADGEVLSVVSPVLE